jgi:hypothetical protein
MNPHIPERAVDSGDFWRNAWINAQNHYPLTRNMQRGRVPGGAALKKSRSEATPPIIDPNRVQALTLMPVWASGRRAPSRTFNCGVDAREDGPT